MKKILLATIMPPSNMDLQVKQSCLNYLQYHSKELQGISVLAAIFHVFFPPISIIVKLVNL